MSKKSSILSVIILSLIILGGAFIINKSRTEDSINDLAEDQASDMVEDSVSNATEGTPSNPPDTMPNLLMLNGNLIEMNGDFQQISPNTQDKIDKAKLLGLTVAQVTRNESPAEELQTNFIGKDWSLYYYKDNSQEAYIFIDNNRVNYCFYQTLQ